MKLAVLLMIVNWLPQTVADQTCLAATLYLEARDQPVLGQVAIAEVALRRQRADRSRPALCTVLIEPRQFALGIVSPRTPIRNLGAWNRAWRIAGTTLARWSESGESLSVVPAANHFYAVHRVTPYWTKHGEWVAQIGDHAFYRLAP